MMLRLLLRKHGKWLLLIVSSAAGLLFCEGAVRLLEFAPPVHDIWLDDEESFYQRSTNAILNYEIKPDLQRDLEPGRTTVNSHGLRDLPRSVAKPEGVRRILLLGDSVVEGIIYVDDESTLSRQLEQLYSKGETEVLNFGTSGYCTLAEVELLRTKGLGFAPDVVVVIFVINDYDNFNPETTTAGGVRDRPNWSKHLFVRSHLFRHLAIQRNWFGFADEADPTILNRRAIGDNNVVKGLGVLQTLANEHGFQVVIVPWPVFEDDAITYPDRTGSPTLLIERLGAYRGFPVVPIADRFRAVVDPDDNPRTLFTVKGDRMHPNPTGAGLAAGFLKDIIATNKATPPYTDGERDPEAVVRAIEQSNQTEVGARSLGQRHYQSLMRQARGADALAYLHSLTRQNPRHPWANLSLGRHLYRIQDYDAAKPHLRIALELNPSNVEARHLLAYLLSTQGQHAEAIKLLQQGLARLPNEPNLHLALGAVSLTNSQFKLAAKHLKIARQLTPNQPALDKLSAQLEQRPK